MTWDPSRIGASRGDTAWQDEASSSTAVPPPQARRSAPPSPDRLDGLPRQRRATDPDGSGRPRTALPAAPELPGEIWQVVAGRLPHRDTLSLSMASQAVRHAIGQEATHARGEILRQRAGDLEQAGPHAVVGQVHAFLRAVEQLPAAERTAALALLRDTLQRLPHHSPSAFALLDHWQALVHADALPEPQRAEALAAGAAHVASTANPQAQRIVFDSLVQRLERLPGEHRAEALAALVPQLDELPQGARPRRVIELLALSRELPAERVGSLPLSLVRNLAAPAEPSEAFELAWHDAMRLVEAAPVEERAEALRPLAMAVASLPEPGRAAALQRAMALLPGLDNHDRGFVLSGVAAAVQHLTHRRGELFDATLAALHDLPPPLRADGLRPLLDAAGPAEAGRAGQRIRDVLQCLEGLPDNDRARVVVGAAHALRHASPPGALPLEVLEQIVGLPPRMQRLPLEAVFTDTRWAEMPPADVARTAKALLSAVSRLPPGLAGDAAVQAALHLPLAHPEAGPRREMFMALVRQAGRTPSAGLVEVLARRLQEAWDPALLQQAFEPLLELAGRLGGRSSTLGSLALQLNALPDHQLHAAWPRLRGLAERDRQQGVPAYSLDRVVGGLAETLPRLAAGLQREALAWVLQAIPSLFEERSDMGARTQTLTRLASAVPSLPQALRQDAFDTALARVGDCLAADRRASPQLLHDDAGHPLHPSSRTADLLARLAAAAGALPGLAPREATGRILDALPDIDDPAARAAVLKALARGGLPAALEQPASWSAWAAQLLKRHVGPEVLLDRFARQIDQLPAGLRTATLDEMLQAAPADGALAARLRASRQQA